MEYSHRLTWMLGRGPIPEGMFVLHNCDNPMCVNLRHLFLGTHGDNMDDKVMKGRASGPTFNPRRGELCPTAKLTWADVREIRHLRETQCMAQTELAMRFNVGQNAIWKILNGKTWV